MGRIYARSSPVESWQDSTLALPALTECGGQSQYSESIRKGGGGDEIRCFDRLGRLNRVLSQGQGGDLIAVDHYFDSEGRMERQSEPYLFGSVRYWNTTEYDSMDRPVRISGANGGQQEIFYDEAAGNHCVAGGIRQVRYVNELGQEKV